VPSITRRIATERDRSCVIPLHQRLRALKSLNNGSGCTPSAALSIFGSATPNDPWAAARLQEEDKEEHAAAAAEEQPQPAPATLRADDVLPPSAGATKHYSRAMLHVT
jgi:hypothetical protein